MFGAHDDNPPQVASIAYRREAHGNAKRAVPDEVIELGLWGAVSENTQIKLTRHPATG